MGTKLTVSRVVVGVLRRGATGLQLSARGRVDGDGVGPEKGVQMRLGILSRVHDGVNVLVHEHVHVNVRVGHGLRGETENDEKHPVQTIDGGRRKECDKERKGRELVRG